MSWTLNDAQQNYIAMEKEMLVVMFDCDKFCLYIIGFKVIIYMDHATIQHLFAKTVAKPQ